MEEVGMRTDTQTDSGTWRVCKFAIYFIIQGTIGINKMGCRKSMLVNSKGCFGGDWRGEV